MKSKRRQRGSTVLEFGLSFLLFFFVVYGVMEFGRMVTSYNILAGATREAARYATVHGSSSGSLATSTDIQTLVRNWSIGLDSSAVSVTTTWSPGTGPGSAVTVKATYNAKPFTSLLIGNTLTLQSSSQMVISQ